MKHGLISDVHANREALEAVLRRLDEVGVDRVICLGDLVGYHADVSACIALVRRRCEVVIAGNHDRAAVGAIDTWDFSFPARRAIAWTRPRLAEEEADYLRQLPLFADLDASTLLVHGALHPAPNERVHLTTPERIADSLSALDALGARICFFGHTHKAMVHERRGGVIRSVVGWGDIELADGARYLVNPGSVGQPRDGDWRAACAVYDDDKRVVRFMRVEYDDAGVRARAEAAGLFAAPSFARRLFERARARVHRARSIARRTLGHQG